MDIRDDGETIHVRLTDMQGVGWYYLYKSAQEQQTEQRYHRLIPNGPPYSGKA